MSDIKYKILKKLYLSNRISRFLVNKYINKHEGGEYHSKTLRKIYSEAINSNIGIASYGCFSLDFCYGQSFDIGNYCSIAIGVKWIPGNHPMDDVSTHPFFHREEFGYFKKEKNTQQKLKKRTIGNDVWIGRDVLILPKVKTIGNGAIIGAGSVVTHDVEPYSVVAGNPAKLIKYRFGKEVIEQLEKSKWWELQPDQLRNAIKYKNDVNKFCNEIDRLKDNIENRG